MSRPIARTEASSRQTFYGLSAAKSAPAEIVERLNKSVNAGLADPTMWKKFADLGGMQLAGSPADYGKFLAAETDKWAKVIREPNIALME